jgi:hypothetical protein
MRRARALAEAAIREAAQPPVPPARGGRLRTVADLAALVFYAAVDPARSRAELDQAVGGMLVAAADLGALTRRFRDASDLARQLGLTPLRPASAWGSPDQPWIAGPRAT